MNAPLDSSISISILPKSILLSDLVGLLTFTDILHIIHEKTNHKTSSVWSNSNHYFDLIFLFSSFHSVAVGKLRPWASCLIKVPLFVAANLDTPIFHPLHHVQDFTAE